MTFTPIINEAAERRGVRSWYVVDEPDGVWLGTVRIGPDVVGFSTSSGIFATQDQLVRIAKFIAEKLDEK